jgi:FRG domain
MDQRVSSWVQLQEQLYEGSWHEPLGRFRSDFAFRGMSRAHADLTTSLVRLGGDAHELERHLLRNFRKYAGRGDVPVDSVGNWLALGQHHGLPTRLARHPDLARRIVVPAELKWEIRDKLDQANITEHVLFPELDGLSRWVARYYTPR